MTDSVMPTSSGPQQPPALSSARREVGGTKTQQHPPPQQVRSSRETRSLRQRDDSSVATSAAAKWYRRRLGSSAVDAEKEENPSPGDVKDNEAASARAAKKRSTGKAHVHKKSAPPKEYPSLAGQLLPALFFLLLSGAGLMMWWRHVATLVSEPLKQRVQGLEQTSEHIQIQLQHLDAKISAEVDVLKKELEGRVDTLMTSEKALGHSILARLEEAQLSLQKLQQDQVKQRQQFFDNIQAADAGGLNEQQAHDLVKSLFDSWMARRDESLLTLEEVQAAAKLIVHEEVEKHAADGIGRVDFAVESGGGRVVDHSEGFFHHRGKWTMLALSFLPGSHHRHPLADRVLQPSLGEPGQCLPLRGSDVFVDVSLRMAIHPEAVTLEHVSRLVAFDLSSAPRQFQVWGWLANGTQAHRVLGVETPKPLGLFTYLLEGPRIQTFNLSDSSGKVINMVRLQVLSNYGSQTHTCLYRLRVHGFSPGPPTDALS